MPDIKIKDEAKQTFKNIYKWIIRLYIIIITILAFSWSPFVKYAADEDARLITIDIDYFDYHKTILLQ